jgi:hypothetical protein
MAVRFYLAPWETVAHAQFGTVRQAKADRYSAGGQCRYVGDNPARAWTIVKLDVADHTAALADADLLALPNRPLATLLSDLTTQQRNAIRNRLNTLGIVSDWDTELAAAGTLRTLLRRLGRRIAADFDPVRWGD